MMNVTRLLRQLTNFITTRQTDLLLVYLLLLLYLYVISNNHIAIHLAMNLS